ncbi:hypothetical protein caldi_22300 [Caldinitratiruptor microaerophilus]|uniref:HMA domain-containing protein n=1 Tax=Caldinitratiruptor microaerophilus TaxID=671077 RepID=A0AA35CKT8_9FIRM|nr:hypothetical protein caldi_22300 [Caldinitratiruptor microaerophilus]
MSEAATLHRGDVKGGVTRLTFGLKGMTCASCANRIQSGLRKVPGVQEAVVNFATEKATVTFDPAQAGPEAFRRVVEDLGYGVVDGSVKLSLVGMTCQACAQRIERKLNQLPGVLEATVNFAAETALVRYLPGAVGVADMKKAVKDLGYEAFAKDEEGAADAEKEAREREMKRQWRLSG